MAAFDDLAGRVAIVTGGAQGIGRATVNTLAAHGMFVVIADLNDERGTRVADENDAAGNRAAYVYADVGTADGCEAMVQFARDRFGPPHTLVNNARWHPHVPLADVTEADWDRSQDVLIKSHYLAAKVAIPYMIEAGGGSIVGISSLHAVQSSDGEGPYEAAKGAINALMRNLAVTYGRDGIRANAILPGGILTDVKEEAARVKPDPEQAELSALLNPIGRRGVAQDIANAVLFLASDLSSFVTGSSLVVDGGMSIELPGSAAQRALAWERSRG